MCLFVWQIHHERWHSNGRQHISQIGFVVRAVDRVGGSRTKVDTARVRKVATVILALVQRRTPFAEQLVRELARPPTLTQVGELLERLAARSRLGSANGVDQDERPHTLRVGGGEERRHAAALVRGQHDGSRSAGRVQHGPQILHPRLERGELAPVIGETGAALVEQD